MIRDLLDRLLHPAPDYVEQGGNPIGRQPYLARRATILGFALDADRDALVRLVDRNLNAPRGTFGVHGTAAFGRYVPLVPQVFYVAADLPDLRSGDPAEAGRGFTPETDFAFWVPVARVRRLGPVRWIDWIGFFIPYLFVDEGWALIAGRETFGMPKLLSTNGFAREATDPGVFSIDTQVIPRFGPTAEAVTRRLATARRLDAPERGPLEVRVSDEVDLLGFLFRDVLGIGQGVTLPGAELFVELAECLAKVESHAVTLKQFRDAADPRLACYQALVQATFSYRNVTGAGLLQGTWEVTLDSTDSHPLAADLGLKPRQKSRIAPWMQLDFTMENGRTLWEAR